MDYEIKFEVEYSIIAHDLPELTEDAKIKIELDSIKITKDDIMTHLTTKDELKMFALKMTFKEC